MPTRPRGSLRKRANSPSRCHRDNANVLAIGAFFTAARLASAMADEFLEHSLGDGYEAWDGFYDYHRLGYDECENFDYNSFKADGFQVSDPTVPALGPEPQGLAF